MTDQNPLLAAQTHLFHGRYKNALKTAKAAMARHGRDPALPNIIGLAMCGLGQQRKAIEMFQKAIRLDPHFADARRNLAQTLILLNLPDKALEALDRLLSDAPPDAGALYLRAQALANLGRTEEAVAAVSAAIESGPPHARNFNLRGVLRNTLGLTAEALEDFETALRLNPDNVETLINISLPLARQTRHDDALAAARRATQLAPAHIGAHLRLAAAHVEAGQPREAAEEYRKVLDLAPQNAEAIQQLAALQTRDGNAALEPTARAALKRAGARAQDRASLNFALARIAEQAGEAATAAGYLAAANRDMAGLMP